MFIRQPPIYFDLNGNPAYDFEVYIGKSNTDPRVEANKLAVTDGQGGAACSNPYSINSSGLAKNLNGEVIDPFIASNEYCIEVRSSNGLLVYRNPKMLGDVIGAGGAGSSTVDAVINNFAAALLTDMSLYDLIFIQSYATGWEGTAAGNLGGFYAYRTGTIGTASTGNPGIFYDSMGNQFKPTFDQRLYVEMFGGKAGIGNDCGVAIQNMITAGQSTGKPCYFDDDIYYIATQNHIATGYSLMSTYAVKVTDDVSLIGNGNTIIKTTTANNQEYQFFFENVDSLYIDGLTFDANSTNIKTGALYLAGVTNATLNCKVKNSAPVYLSGSTTRQTDTVRGSLVIESAMDFAISGNSCGFKRLDLPNGLMLTGCNKGIEVTNANVGSFGYTPTKPVVNLGPLIATTTLEVFNCVTGSIRFTDITGTGKEVFKFTLGTGDFDLITGNSISGAFFKIIELLTTGGGRLKKFWCGYARSTGLAVGVHIYSASQLCDEVKIGYVDFICNTGVAYGFALRDDTRLGKVMILGGSVVGDRGIDIDNAGFGQDLLIRNLDLSGCTTRIVGAPYATWLGEPASQAYVANTTLTFEPYVGWYGGFPSGVDVFIECTATDGNFAVGDTFKISPAENNITVADYGFSLRLTFQYVYLIIAQNGICLLDDAAANNDTVVLTDSKWKIYLKCSDEFNNKDIS